MEKIIKPNTSIQPSVNIARAFFEIANNFSDNREILREALSNSYDADATEVKMTFELTPKPDYKRAKIINITIEDNGTGLSSSPENGNNCSALEAFFNLGDSNKIENQIGSKGHGTKIYYKSKKIILDSWKNGKHIHAETQEEDLWNTLKIPRIPHYMFNEITDNYGKGTVIKIEDFISNQNTFRDVESLKDYILWYTIMGSFEHYFNKNYKKMDVRLKTYYDTEYSKIDFGFNFPEENLNDSNIGIKDFCKYIGPKTISIPIVTGVDIKIQIMGALLGENKRRFIPSTYSDSGLWLCKDFIKIKRNNDIIEKAFGGEFWYKNFFILANCQSFELTAYRNSIKQDTEIYSQVIEAIITFLKDEVKNSLNWKMLESKKEEEKAFIKIENQKKKEKERVNNLEEIVNNYNKRKDLKTDFTNLLIKEPRNEAETILLLQSMISTGKHEETIDFKIGGYDAYSGTDLLVERQSKGSKKIEWVEAVYTLDKLFKWDHPYKSYDKVICWEIGDIDKYLKEGYQSYEDEIDEGGNIVEDVDKVIPTFIKKTKGRYILNFASDTIEVYVLKEILYD